MKIETQKTISNPTYNDIANFAFETTSKLYIFVLKHLKQWRHAVVICGLEIFLMVLQKLHTLKN